MSRIQFFVVTLIAAAVVACACSPAKRPVEEMDSGTDGQVLSGPNPLVSFDGDEHMYMEINMAAWNGKYFGVCYREPFDTFKFMLLDENGVLLNDPVSLFPPIPAPEDWSAPCDIVAIDEEHFAVAMSVKAAGPHLDGMYIVYVNVNPVE